MDEQLTREQFLKEITTHQIQVLRNDGLYRHLRFKRPDTYCMHFDLITWPGYLCYTGDMGTYVFKRLDDMLRFFRKPEGRGIDFRYWAEKAEGADRSGILEFSMAKFKGNVRDFFDRRTDGWEANDRAALWQEIEEEVLGSPEHDSDAQGAYSAAHEFEHKGKQFFVDFWEYNSKVFTHRFLWCCYALDWAVRQYDAATLVPQAHGVAP